MNTTSRLLAVVTALSAFALAAPSAHAGCKKHHHHRGHDCGYSSYNRGWDNCGYRDFQRYYQPAFYYQEQPCYRPVYYAPPPVFTFGFGFR